MMLTVVYVLVILVRVPEKMHEICDETLSAVMMCQPNVVLKMLKIGGNLEIQYELYDEQQYD